MIVSAMFVTHEFRFFSPEMGCDACRISLFDRESKEYFSVLRQDGTEKHNRALRRAALDRIEMAMERGDAPGEVIEEPA